MKWVIGRGHQAVGNHPGKRRLLRPETWPRRRIGNVRRRVESRPRTEFPKFTETVTTIRASNCPRQLLGRRRKGRHRAPRTTCRRSGRTDTPDRTPFRIPTCSKIFVQRQLLSHNDGFVKKSERDKTICSRNKQSHVKWPKGSGNQDHSQIKASKTGHCSVK